MCRAEARRYSRLLQTRQFCSLRPKTLGRSVVLGFLRGRCRTAFVEISAADVGHFGRGGEVDEGLRTFFGRDGKDFRDADDVRKQSASLVPEASGNEAGMKAVGGNAGARQTARELASKQDVREL